MKTKTTIDLVKLKREEMQDNFSDHIDFSDKGFLSVVEAGFLSKEKKVSAQDRYLSALKSLQESTKAESVEDIFSILESRENTPAERKNLNIIKRFH
ncbi:MAG: hypothetical protein AB7I27_00215 [Bacteriovoracaceae bacterium]